MLDFTVLLSNFGSVHKVVFLWKSVRLATLARTPTLKSEEMKMTSTAVALVRVGKQQPKDSITGK